MNLRSILMTIAVCAIGVSTTACSSAEAATKALDKEFLVFWSGFKGALQKNDKAALASMTKLPYGLDEKLDRAAFIAKSESIFPLKTRKCLLREKPIADQNDVMVFCGDDIFIFTKDKGKYKFTEIGVND